MEFKHFIITRFNVNIEPVEFLGRIQNPWLSLRFDLFQRFCFPSVRGQQHQNFTWLVLFDEKTPKKFKKLIDAYKTYANFRPIFFGPYDTVLPKIIEEIRRESKKEKYILTTRLDNDDSLSENFTFVLYKFTNHFLKEKMTENFYFNFTNGLQIFENKIYDFKDRTNAFVSLLEKNDSIETVFCVDHPAIYKKYKVLQIKTDPLWLQNVHETNIYNYLRGTCIGQANELKGFNISL